MNLELDEKAIAQMGQLVEEFKSEFFKSMQTPIKHVYIDLEVLQDFRLGALFCLITTDAEYQYIKHVLEAEDSKYQTRLDDLTMTYFPAITAVTDKQIDEFIANKANHKALVKVGPMTFMYTQLREMMHVIVEKNLSIDKALDPSAKFYIGTNSVQYDDEDMVNLLVAIFSIDQRFRAEIYNKPLYAIGRDFSEYQLFYINNVSDFLQHPNHVAMFKEDVPIFDSTVFGHPLLSVPVDSPEKQSELLTNTELFFNTFTNFYYIPRGVGL